MEKAWERLLDTGQITIVSRMSSLFANPVAGLERRRIPALFGANSALVGGVHILDPRSKHANSRIKASAGIERL